MLKQDCKTHEIFLKINDKFFYLFYRLLEFVYLSFLKARKFLVAVTAAILTYVTPGGEVL